MLAKTLDYIMFVIFRTGLNLALLFFILKKLVYTGATSNVPVIFVLTRPFFLHPNRDIIRSNKTLFGGREKGAVKTEITDTFEVAPV